MSTEVKPSDWDESDNRWEPTPGGGGGVPTPTPEDSGKVLTAGADGTASWQTAGGGGDFLLIYATGGTTPETGVIVYTTNVSLAEVEACFNASGVQTKPIFVFYPHPTESSPYFDYVEYSGEMYMADNPWNSSRVDIDNYSMNLTAYETVTIVAQSK